VNEADKPIITNLVSRFAMIRPIKGESSSSELHTLCVTIN